MTQQPPRIYHHHVRKTAGSSLNTAFWSLGGFEGLNTRPLAKERGVFANGLRFVGYNRELIERGDYFYGTSHFPAWWLDLPPDTFTVTILRDPAARAFSYFRNLMWARAHENDPTASEIEPFAGLVSTQSRFIDGGRSHIRSQLAVRNIRLERASIKAFGPLEFLARLDPRRRESLFLDFLKRVPPRLLFSQLHMFSEYFDPTEAARNALSCSAVCFTETYTTDLAKVSERLGLHLVERHERRFTDEIEISESERAQLRIRLAPEYEMIERVRASLGN